MIDFDKFVMAAPPRTGIKCFSETVKRAGIRPLWFPHEEYLPSLRGDQTFVVSIIRHPYAWLKSLYFNLPPTNMKMHKELAGIVQIARTSKCFFDLVARVSAVPGCVGRVFDSYRANSVLRLEDFPWAIHSLLDLFDCPDRNVSHERLNIGLQVSVFEDDAVKLRKLILKTESAFCQKYEFF